MHLVAKNFHPCFMIKCTLFKKPMESMILIKERIKPKILHTYFNKKSGKLHIICVSKEVSSTIMKERDA